MFCLLMFLFRITWYFKILCLKAYKFWSKNGINVDNECLITLSGPFADGEWVAVFKSQKDGFWAS